MHPATFGYVACGILVVLTVVAATGPGSGDIGCRALERLAPAPERWQKDGQWDARRCRWVLALDKSQKSRFYQDLHERLTEPDLAVHRIDLVWGTRGLTGGAEFRWRAEKNCVVLTMNRHVLLREAACEFRPPSQYYRRVRTTMALFLDLLGPYRMESEQYKEGYYSLVLVNERPLRQVFARLLPVLEQLQPELLVVKIGRLRRATGTDPARVQERMRELPEQAAVLEVAEAPFRLEFTFAATRQGTHVVIMVGWPRGAR